MAGMLPLGTIDQKAEIGGMQCNIPVEASMGFSVADEVLHVVVEATANLGDIQDKFDAIAKSLEPASEMGRKDGQEVTFCVHHLIKSASLEAGGATPVVKCAVECEVWSYAHNPVGGVRMETRRVCHTVVIPAISIPIPGGGRRVIRRESRSEVCVDVPTEVPHVTDGPDIKLAIGSDVLDAKASISLSASADGKDVAVGVNVSEVTARGAVTEAIRQAVDVVARMVGRNVLDAVNGKLAESCRPRSLSTLLPEGFRDYQMVLSKAEFVTLSGNRIGTHVVAKLDIPAEKLAALLQAAVPH